MSIVGIIGILIGIVLLIWLTVKGVHVVVLAPLCALIVIIMNGMAPLSSITEVFMGGTVGLFQNLFFILLFGAIFAAIFEKSGAALSIVNGILGIFAGKGDLRSKRGTLTCIIAMIVISAIFMFGGLDAMTELVTVFPICLAMCKKMNVSRNLVPALAFSTGVWAVCAPGAPQAANSLASGLCQTPSTAGLIPGIVASAVMAVATIVYLNWEFQRSIKLGETFESLPNDPDMSDERKTPNFILSLIPLVAIFIFYNVAKLPLFVAILIGVVIALVIFAPTLYAGPKGKFGELLVVLEKGCNTGIRITVIAAVLAGFGAVVSNTPTFQPLMAKLGSSPMPVIILCLLIVAVVCAITSNSNGGIQIALNITMPLAQSANVSMAALHRVAVFSAASLNTLPTNPGVMIVCQLAGVPVKKAYRPLFVTTVLLPFIGALIVALMYMAIPGMA